MKNEKNVYFEPVEGLDLSKCLDTLRNKYKYEQILVECGVSTTKPYYMKQFPWEDDLENENFDITNEMTEQLMSGDLDVCPFDTLVLSVFHGFKIHQSCVGPLFPSLPRLS